MLSVFLLITGAALFVVGLALFRKDRSDPEALRINGIACYLGVTLFLLGVGQLLARLTKVNYWIWIIAAWGVLELAAYWLLRPRSKKKK